MSYKTMVTAGAVGVLALAAGIGVGARWMRMGPQEAMERYSLVPKSQLLADRDRATVEIDALKAARRDLERDRKDLADRLALAKAERTAGKTSSQSGGPSEKLPVAFGKFAGLEALSRADWQTLAQTMAHVQSYMSARQEKRKQGEPGDLDKEFWEENDKLVKFAATLVGKMPTNQWGVGEFTHPIVVANFTAALLEAAGVPLSEEQRAEVASAGAEYEKEYAKVQEGYGSDAIRLEKVLDELDLKQASATAMRKVLTPEQLDFLAPSDLRDRAWIKESMGADCLSPSVMAMTLARAEYLDSASAVREEIPRKIADGYGLDEAQRAAAAPAFEAWYRSIERTLEPVSRQDPTSIDAVIAAGRAQEALRKDLLALPGLSEKARTAIADDPGWFLPMVEKKQ